jgi:hypothetical protein
MTGFGDFLSHYCCHMMYVIQQVLPFLRTFMCVMTAHHQQSFVGILRDMRWRIWNCELEWSIGWCLTEYLIHQIWNLLLRCRSAIKHFDRTKTLLYWSIGIQLILFCPVISNYFLRLYYCGDYGGLCLNLIRCCCLRVKNVSDPHSAEKTTMV